MSDIENQDLYDGTGSDTPLIDSLGSAVKRLIDKGKIRGYITVEELNKALPPERESSENIEDIMSGISDMGISIIAESEVDSFEPDVVEEEEEFDESGNFDEKELGRNDDPVRMYLKEMGSVELLSRDGEIAIAKRIEAGKTVMIDGLCESPMTIKAIAGWRDELLAGTMQLRDIIDLEMMYGDDAEAIAFEDDEDTVDDLEKVAEELATKDNLDDIDDDWKTILNLTARLTKPTMKMTTKPTIWRLTRIMLRRPMMKMTLMVRPAGLLLRFLQWKRLCANLFWRF